MEIFAVLAGASFRRNLAYVKAHMATNVGSILFGLVYMALWRAVDHGRTLEGQAPSFFLSYIALSQFVLWVSTFLPAYLGIHLAIRSGQIALEFVRPVPYLPRMLASGMGEVLYNVAFRSLPMALVFTVLGVFPWALLLKGAAILQVTLALFLAGLTGVVMQYLVGIASFWTVEARWARRLYFALVMTAGGQILPLFLLPGWAAHLLRLLPFQTLVYFPAAVWLRRATAADWVSALTWTVVLLAIAAVVTEAARRRLEVQGG